jgi:hypothetical protein
MDTMPPRYAFRLEDLRTWHVVEAECGSCGHRAVIDHASLTHGRPSSMRLADLEMSCAAGAVAAAAGIPSPSACVRAIKRYEAAIKTWRRALKHPITGSPHDLFKIVR